MLRSRTFAALLLLLGCALFVRLGLWQLDRAAADDAESKRVAERSIQPPLQLPAAALPPLDELVYRRAVIEGSFESGAAVLLDNRTRDGVLGFHLIVPFRPRDSERRVLVNRGFVAREEALRVAEGGEQEVRGLIIRPSLPPLRLGLDQQAAGGWGNRWPFLDLDYFARSRGYPVERFVLIEDPRLAQELLTSGLDGERRWGMHMGYALQWFAFAAVALGSAGALLRRRSKGEEPAD